jgi:RND family efflux transporter MFP subunit
MKAKTVKLSIIASLLVLASCSDKATKNKAIENESVVVKTATIGANTDQANLSASGRVEAVQSANISTRIMGHVEAVKVELGQKVTKGQLLAKVGNTDMSAKLAQVKANTVAAEAAYKNVEKDYKRFEALVAANSASKKEWDDISTLFEASKAQWQAAKQMEKEVMGHLAYSDLRAPFNGVVTNKFVKVGDLAKPGVPLFEVEAPGEFQVVVRMPESQVNQFDAQGPVSIFVKSLDKTFAGKVLAASSSAKNTGGQYLVKISLEGPSDDLKSGMFVNAHFNSLETDRAATLYLPESALVKRGQLTGVYVASSQNTALLRWLRLGKRIDGKAEVLSGLTQGETYIASSEGKLYNGAPITVQ